MKYLLVVIQTMFSFYVGITKEIPAIYIGLFTGLLLFLLLKFTGESDSNQKDNHFFKTTLIISAFILFIYSFVINFSFYYSELNLTRILGILIGMALILVGNVIPKSNLMNKIIVKGEQKEYKSKLIGATIFIIAGLLLMMISTFSMSDFWLVVLIVNFPLFILLPLFIFKSVNLTR